MSESSTVHGKLEDEACTDLGWCKQAHNQNTGEEALNVQDLSTNPNSVYAYKENIYHSLACSIEHQHLAFQIRPQAF